MVVEWVAEEVPPYRWTNGRKVEMGGGDGGIGRDSFFS